MKSHRQAGARRHPAGVRAAIAAIALATLASGCAQSFPAPSGPELSTRVFDAEYRLAIGDKVRVVVFGEDPLSGEFVISNEGEIALPLLGSVKATGLTIPELRAAIQGSLSLGYVKQPRVSVDIAAYRPVYILGEINKPGAYPFAEQLTVMSAVASAGGFTYRANTRRVFIKGANEPVEHSYRLTAATQIAPGDTIRIGERLF